MGEVTKKSILRKAAKVIVIATIALVGWNLPIIWGVSKPAILSTGVMDMAQADTGDERPEKNMFQYPRLGIAAPLAESAASSPLSEQSWEQMEKDLRQGVNVSYLGNDFASEPVVYVSGHSSDTYPHKYAAVFAALSQARVGDEFTIARADSTATFRVTEKKIVHPTDVQAFMPSGENNQLQQALLVTCWPLLTTRERLVVVGERAL